MDLNPLFEFVQVAMGNRSSLPAYMDGADWQSLFDCCQRQAIAGIGFAALERLRGLGMECPEPLRMQWWSVACQLKEQNRELNRQCAELSWQYGHDGLSVCMLSGQGNLLNYPEELQMRRVPEGMEVWCVPSYGGMDIAVQTGKEEVEYVHYSGQRAVMEYVRMLHRLAGHTDKPRQSRHSIEAPAWEGTEVKVHFRVGQTHSLLRNWRMQRWFQSQAEVCMRNRTQMGFAVPTSSVNVVYQLVSLYANSLEGKWTLRQLMDCYYALRIWHNDVMECRDLHEQGLWSEGVGTPVMSPSEVMAVLRSFGLARFVAAVMYALLAAFAMPASYVLCEPNEVDGRRWLSSLSTSSDSVWPLRGGWLRR